GVAITHPIENICTSESKMVRRSGALHFTFYFLSRELSKARSTPVSIEMKLVFNVRKLSKEEESVSPPKLQGRYAVLIEKQGSFY
ncbi:hypothetical protein, partial [Oceanobacillus oncorhynchi]|uniref:hypothetical protein n=1 Tax=Oceanobacillus oncorhynchi TaxID=545501 RepID=UPI0034D47A32